MSEQTTTYANALKWAWAQGREHGLSAHQKLVLLSLVSYPELTVREAMAMSGLSWAVANDHLLYLNEMGLISITDGRVVIHNL